MNESKVTLPTVHLNGTSAMHLRNDLETAMSALRIALETLQDAAPNARDYYPEGQAIVERARKEHEARVEKLSGVLAELGQIHEHVANYV